MISDIKRGGMRKEEVQKRLEEIFGNGSSVEIEGVTTNEKIVERIRELSKREAQYLVREKMRLDARKRQREDRRLNLFWRKNKTFPVQFGSEEETPETEETLAFWRSINNKEPSEGWKEDRSIREVLVYVGKMVRRGRSCR